jgi:hypothetical protein
VNHDKNNDILQCGTAGNNHDLENSVGLAQGHAYTVLSAHKVNDGSKDIKLLKMRNPWGSEDYKGDWSDKSSLWTDDLRSQVGGAPIKNDGEFFITVADYRKHVKYTTVNYNEDKLTRAHHLTLNDKKNDGSGSTYCHDCTAHKYTLTSDKD